MEIRKYLLLEKKNRWHGFISRFARYVKPNKALKGPLLPELRMGKEPVQFMANLVVNVSALFILENEVHSGAKTLQGVLKDLVKTLPDLGRPQGSTVDKALRV